VWLRDPMHAGRRAKVMATAGIPGLDRIRCVCLRVCMYSCVNEMQINLGYLFITSGCPCYLSTCIFYSSIFRISLETDGRVIDVKRLDAVLVTAEELEEQPYKYNNSSNSNIPSESHSARRYESSGTSNTGEYSKKQEANHSKERGKDQRISSYDSERKGDSYSTRDRREESDKYKSRDHSTEIRYDSQRYNRSKDERQEEEQYRERRSNHHSSSSSSRGGDRYENDFHYSKRK